MTLNNISIDNCYWINGMMCLYVADFDFFSDPNLKTSFENFLKIAKFLFGNNILKNISDFSSATDYLLRRTQFSNDHHQAKAPYYNLLCWLMNIKMTEPDIVCNSYLYELNFPVSLTRLQNSDGTIQKLIVKSPKTDLDLISKEAMQCAQQELELMEVLTEKYQDDAQIPYFVSCLCYIRIKQQLYLFTEYFHDGDLQNFFDKKKEMIDEKLIYRMSKELLQCNHFIFINLKGITEFHQFGYVHQDLKPSNIFLKQANDSFLIGFYLADFNLSCKVKNTVAVAGTPQYAPLEFKLVREANQKSDIWQLGLILYQAANYGNYIWNLNDYDEQFKIQQIQRTIGSRYSEEFIKLIFECLQKQVELRPTSEQLIKQWNNFMFRNSQMNNFMYTNSQMQRSQSMYIPAPNFQQLNNYASNQAQSGQILNKNASRKIQVLSQSQSFKQQQ